MPLSSTRGRDMAIGDDRLQKMAQEYVVPEKFTHGDVPAAGEMVPRGPEVRQAERGQPAFQTALPGSVTRNRPEEKVPEWGKVLQNSGTRREEIPERRQALRGRQVADKSRNTKIGGWRRHTIIASSL